MRDDLEKVIKRAQQAVLKEKKRQEAQGSKDPQSLDKLFSEPETAESLSKVIIEKIKGVIGILISILIILAVLVLLSSLFSRGSHDRDDYIEPRAPDDYRV